MPDGSNSMLDNEAYNIIKKHKTLTIILLFIFTSIGLNNRLVFNHRYKLELQISETWKFFGSTEK